MAEKIKNPEAKKEPDKKVYTPEELQRVHDEAYKKGFGDGFDKRGELESDEDFEENPDEEPE